MGAMFGVSARPWKNTHLHTPKPDPPKEAPKPDPAPAPATPAGMWTYKRCKEAELIVIMPSSVTALTFYIRGPADKSAALSEFSPYSDHTIELSGVTYATAAHLYWTIRASIYLEIVRELQSHVGHPAERTIPRLLAVAARIRQSGTGEVMWKWRRVSD